MAPNVRAVVPFFRVSDMERSLRYYVDGLGFALEKAWEVEGEIRWCRLELGGAALMLQHFRTEGHDSWRPQGAVGEGVSLYFACEDALAVYREAKVRGLAVSEPQVGNGNWELFLRDPDGYRINFTSPTTVPEETTFSEVRG